MINSVILAGRLTTDIEVKTSGENAMASFVIAVNRTKKGEADFIRCTAFGKTADTLSKFVSKGDQIILKGSLRVDQINDKEGNKRTYTNVTVDSFDFGAKKSSSSNEASTLNEVMQAIDDQEDLPF